MEMGTANLLHRVRSPCATQNPVITQISRDRLPTVSSKKPTSKTGPTISVVEG